MCLGDLAHITNKYEDFLTIPDTNGSRNYFMKNTTNATVEKSFAIQKADKWDMKLPLDVFFKKHWTELQGRQREYWDGIMKGIGEKLNGTVGKNETKGLRKTFTNCQSSKHEVPPTVN